MARPDLSSYEPSSKLAHELINKLAIIVGNCDLLEEEAPEDSHCLKRLRAIREVAMSMAKSLHPRQGRLEKAGEDDQLKADNELCLADPVERRG